MQKSSKFKVQSSNQLKLKLKIKIKEIFIFTFIFLFTLISSKNIFAESIQEKIYQKQQELEAAQKKINVLDSSIKAKEKEVKTAEQQISILEQNIEQRNLEIQKTDIAVDQTKFEIENTQNEISIKETLINREKEIIKNYLVMLYKSDNDSFLDILLSENQLSEAWMEFEAIKNVQSKMQDILASLKEEKQKLKQNEDALLAKQEEQNDLLMMQQAQKQALQSDKALKENFAKKAGEKKNQLAADLDNTTKIKNILREEIFNLKSSGVSMSMQKALEIAGFAASKTGIRPEFLLGLLKVESDLGNNVGTGNYKTDMNPAQHDAFFAITKKLGVDPETAPVSKRPTNYKGWGGAMGPAQFMPKTWLGYEADISSLTGHNPASPWDNTDAFTAAALKLSRDGASSKTRDGEFKAAMLYLAGSNWNNPSLAWYGERVLKLAEAYGS